MGGWAKKKCLLPPGDFFWNSPYLKWKKKITMKNIEMLKNQMVLIQSRTDFYMLFVVTVL